ncbi:MAG: protein adenylyltransferase SelO [Francisellaceae bacterium]
MPTPKLCYSYTTLPETFYSEAHTEKFNKPSMVILNGTLAKEIGLDIMGSSPAQILDFLLGYKSPSDAKPIAMAYAGHQFRHFTMLGDGRALLLGEHITQKNKRLDIHLKGSGATPYSRGGDGHAALGSMLREYMISEAMHALGIPSTRSLAVIDTGQFVQRDGLQPGAILVRVAESHIRVGTFEYAAMLGHDQLRALFDYTINRHLNGCGLSTEQAAATLLRNVIKKQAQLIAKWQSVGFIHGVMNTDNMAISGQTIDYGPCAFMDNYHPDTVFSSIDRHGRYSFKNQTPIGHWNLTRFAETLLPLLASQPEEAIAIATDLLQSYWRCYADERNRIMCHKLGLSEVHDDNLALVDALLGLMQDHALDYNKTFSDLSVDERQLELLSIPEFKCWHDHWGKRIKPCYSQALQLMKKHNPWIIPRNHLLEEALSVATDKRDYTKFNDMLVAVSHPFEVNENYRRFHTPPKAHERVTQTFCGT